MLQTDFRSNRSRSPYESSKGFGRELHDIFLVTLNTSHATDKNYVTVDPHCGTYFDISCQYFKALHLG